MAIFCDELHDDRFAIVPNFWLRDPRLSGKAKGYLAYIKSHKSGYVLSIAQMVAQMADGRDAVYAGLRELVDLGYLVREQTRNAAGKLGEIDYRFGPAAREQQYEDVFAGQPDPGAGEKADELPKRPSRRRGGVSAGGTVCGKPVYGSAVYGSADTKKTKVLENHLLENQPPTTAAHPEAGQPSPADAVTRGGRNPSKPAEPEPGAATESGRVLSAVVSGLKPTQVPSVAQSARLRVMIEDALTAGWSSGDLVARLGDGGLSGFDSARRVFGVLRYRIEQLPAIVRPEPPAGVGGEHPFVLDAETGTCLTCHFAKGNYRHGARS